MFELSACIEMLFRDEELDIADRIRAAANAGLPAVEFYGWRAKDIDSIATALTETGVQLALFSSEPAGALVDRNTHDSFVADVGESAQLAQRLGCTSLMVFSGDRIRGVGENYQRSAIVAALKRAASVAAAHGISLFLEPLNTRIDHIGYFLDRTEDGLAIIEEVNEANVRLLFDFYHSAVMGEKFEATLDGRVGLIGHIHVADIPGRHEPGSGEIDWPGVVAWLKASGYEGAIGLEYAPRVSTRESLRYVEALFADRTAE